VSESRDEWKKKEREKKKESVKKKRERERECVCADCREAVSEWVKKKKTDREDVTTP
jgi:hypothetical protein